MLKNKLADTSGAATTGNKKAALFEIDGDRRYARSEAHSSRFIKLTVVAPPAGKQSDRPAVRIGFVLDRSGSMQGEKIQNARKAIIEGIKMLSARDEYAVVTFDNEIETVIPLTGAKRGATEAESLIRNIEARGNTNLCDGYLTGAREVGGERSGEVVQRVILVSDGHANTGVTDALTLGQHASQLRTRGVSTATLGIGDGFDETLMSAIATSGGGPAQYAAQPSQIEQAIAACIGEALEVTLRDAEVVLRLPGADFTLLTSGDAHLVRGELRIALGDLGANQERDVVARVRLPRGSNGSDVQLSAELSGRSEDGDVRLKQSYTWTYADSDTNDGQERNRPLDRIVAGLYAANAREQAMVINREGDYERAAKLLNRVADRIAGYAGSDRELKELVRKLRNEAEVVARPQTEKFRKEQHYLARNLMESRSADFTQRKRNR